MTIFLERINKKLESLEATERSVIVEKKNDSFLDLYERMKALNPHLKKKNRIWTSSKIIFYRNYDR